MYVLYLLLILHLTIINYTRTTVYVCDTEASGLKNVSFLIVIDCHFLILMRLLNLILFNPSNNFLENNILYGPSDKNMIFFLIKDYFVFLNISWSIIVGIMA